MNKKSVRDVEVAGKRVFVRVDFNVPVENGANHRRYTYQRNASYD